MSERGDVLDEVSRERDAQDTKWGEQNHPDGTGINWVETVFPAYGWRGDAAQHAALLAKGSTERAARNGDLTWLKIFLEEVAEAFAETDEAKLRAELIQAAAVATAWVEAIDRRGHRE